MTQAESASPKIIQVPTCPTGATAPALPIELNDQILRAVAGSPARTHLRRQSQKSFRQVLRPYRCPALVTTPCQAPPAIPLLWKGTARLRCLG